jgi:hypothetical protein
MVKRGLGDRRQNPIVRPTLVRPECTNSSGGLLIRLARVAIHSAAGKDLFRNEEVHRDWRTPLKAVAGVYLILAERSGNQYVGSESSNPEQFRFSVFQILPKTMTRDEVVRRETLYKDKLGTRATASTLD